MGLVSNVSTSAGARRMMTGPRFARGPRSSLRCRRGAFIALLSLVLLAGCKSPVANVSGYMRNKKLNDAVMEYNKYVRWREWDKASAYVKTADQAAFKEKMEDVEETFRLTDFDIKDTTPGENARTASVRVFYRYYWLPSITERKMSVRQRWSWSDEERRWQLDTPFTLPSRAAARLGSETGGPDARAKVSSQASRGAGAPLDGPATGNGPTEN